LCWPANLSGLQIAPQSARFSIDDKDRVQIVPSRVGAIGHQHQLLATLRVGKRDDRVLILRPY